MTEQTILEIKRKRDGSLTVRLPDKEPMSEELISVVEEILRDLHTIQQHGNMFWETCGSERQTELTEYPPTE